jgi:hypothetical protein
VRLPPIPRSEQEAWQSDARAALEAGKYNDNPTLKSEMERRGAEPIPDDAPEEVDTSGACPLFGHYYPGGKSTVGSCLVAQEWVRSLENDSDDSYSGQT